MKTYVKLMARRVAAAVALAAAFGFAGNAKGECRFVAALKEGREQKIVCYGTSLTVLSSNWVSGLQDALDARWPGLATVVNSGLSGKNSATGLAQVQTKVIAYNPDAVLIEFSMNDAADNLNTGKTSAQALADAESNLKAIIAAITNAKPDCEIILETMNDYVAVPGSGLSNRTDLDKHAAMYRRVAAENGYLLIDHWPKWQEVLAKGEEEYLKLVPDGVHPNAQGSTLVTLPNLLLRLFAEDWTVSESATLTADTTVDALTVNSGVTLDLNGCSLTCSSLAGTGTIASPSTDLTAPDTTEPYHVTWITKFGTGNEVVEGDLRNDDNTTPRNLFDGDTTNSGRILVDAGISVSRLPLAVAYDFGAGKKVSKYKIYGESSGSNYTARSPRDWTLEGSNDGSSWTEVDSRTGESWSNNQSKEFAVDESKVASYRYYRMTFTASRSTQYLELNELELFGPGELHVNVPAGAEATVGSLTISGNMKVVKEGEGALSGVTSIAAGSGTAIEMVVDGGIVTTGGGSNLNVSSGGGAGTLTINSGTVEVPGDSNVMLNPNDNTSSTGTVNLNAGGTLKTRRIYSKAAARGTLNFNGGTLQATPTSNAALALIASTATVNVNAPGGTIDSGNRAVTAEPALTGEGGMRFKGGSSITLSGASDYTGGTTIELGTKIITSDADAKAAILGNLVIHGKTKTADENGIAVFEYSSALDAETDLANVSFVNCGDGTVAKVSGNQILVDFVAPVWELAADANWSSLVATYGAPAEDATVLIKADTACTLTIGTDVAVSQIVFTGTNPDVVVNTDATVTTDAITFSGSGENYLKNDGVVVLNGDATLPFHNDSRGTYYVNNGGTLKVSRVTEGSGAPGLLPDGENQLVRVASGSTYDINGVAGNTAAVRLAAGATIKNGGSSSVTTGSKQMPQLILDGAATANLAKSLGIVATGHAESRLDLGEHTLTITGGGSTYSFFLDNTTVRGNGKILVSQGKLSAVNNSQVINGTVEIGQSGYLVITKVNTDTPFTVRDFVNNGTDSSDSSAGALVVTGTLTPGKAIKKLTLADGSTVKATGTAQVVSITFAASGTITVDASEIAAETLQAGDVPVLTVPSSFDTSSATWNVKGAAANIIKKWRTDAGGATKTLYLAKPTGLMVIFR